MSERDSVFTNQKYQYGAIAQEENQALDKGRVDEEGGSSLYSGYGKVHKVFTEHKFYAVNYQFSCVGNMLEILPFIIVSFSKHSQLGQQRCWQWNLGTADCFRQHGLDLRLHPSWTRCDSFIL